MSNVKYTQEDIEFLKDNYAKRGVEYCANNLNLSQQRVIGLANYFGIKLNHDQNNQHYKYKIDPNIYEEIKHPEFVYFLGYFWADGWVSKKDSSTRISIASDDAQCVRQTFLKYCKFTEYHVDPNKYSKTKRCKKQISFSIYDKYFASFLRQYDFHLKSFVDPIKILSHIPEHLRHYWWRGYFDGDGCISEAKYPTYITYCIKFAGTYELNWESLLKLYDELDIKAKVEKYVVSKGRYSTIYFHRRSYIEKFFDYIYPGRYFDFGLLRKFTRMEQCIKDYRKRHRTSQYKNISYNIRSKWSYRIRINKKTYFKSGFNTEEMALAALEIVKSP